MPVEFTITPDALGWRIGRSSAELTYFVGLSTSSDAATKEDVQDYIEDAGPELIPATINALVRDDFEIEELRANLFRVEVSYIRSDRQQGKNPEAGDSQFSFETRGGTQHITHSRETILAKGAGGTGEVVPDFKQAIGVDDNGVQGTDIVVPVYSFNETHWFAPEDVDDTYKNTLFLLTGRVNDDTFKGLQTGEVLFLGATGTRRGTNADDLWEISFAFAASPNITGLSIGDIENITKKGWEYLWVRYQAVEDTDAKFLVMRPQFVYVERVYPAGDMSGLGIGV